MSKSQKGGFRYWISHHVVIFIIALGIFASGAVVLWAATLRIPDLDTFDERIIRQSTKIYDRTEKILLFDVHEDVQRTVVGFDQISRNAKNATVAIEDAEFYEHKGIKPRAILRAIFVNLGSLEFEQGGSTITQQVVKNSLLTSEKLISRKLKEWVLSIKLEQQLSKEEILTHYLNEAPYGGNLYGIEEASEAFFAKPASDLSLAESAYLAALPQAPTYYSPYGENRDVLDKRKNLVLERMLEQGFISKEEYAEARDESVVFQPKPEQRLKAAHFVMYVRQYLEERYGEKAIEEDGLRVITTLNYDLQQSAEKIVKRNALENAVDFNAHNAGMVAVDPKTGQILTMVGSRDYFGEPSPEGCTPGLDCMFEPEVNVTAFGLGRQPGSSFKPFVYATALKKGYTPDTVVFDLRTQFSTACDPTDITNSTDPCYSPQNYDNVFRGPMTFRNALAQSVNIPAVKVLYLAGLDASLQTARDMGISTLTDKSRYGLTLVLGGGEVVPLEMASAYGVFANDGVRNPPVAILRVEDSQGNVLEEFNDSPRRVLDTQIARQISDILSDNVARSPAFGQTSYLYFPNNDVAVKTGTTNDYRDAWIVGYTPTISVATWAGNNNNASMEKRVAGFIVAPMWNEFMQVALAELPHESFPEPRRERTVDLKPVLRGIWNPATGDFDDGIHSILYWVDRSDPRGDTPSRPERDSQFSYWEYPVSIWAGNNG